MYEDQENQQGITQLWDPIQNKYIASISIKMGQEGNNSYSAIQLPNTNLILINYKSTNILIYDFSNIDQQKYILLSSYKFNQLVHGSKKIMFQNGQNTFFGIQIDQNLIAKSIVQENKYGNYLVQYIIQQKLKIYDSAMSIQEIINLEKNVISFKIDQDMSLGIYFSQNNTLQVVNADLGYNQSWSDFNNFYKIIYIAANQSLYFYQVNPITNSLCKKKLDDQNNVEQFPLKSFQGIQPIFIIASDLNSVITLTNEGFLVVYNLQSLQITSFQQTNCNIVENGDYLKNLQIAVFFCSQGNLLQYDLTTSIIKGVTSSIQKISSLSAINEINCIFISEFQTGNIQGYNIKSQQDTLQNFVQIKTKLNYDILGFGYTNDELLFINTYPGNLYIDIKVCLQNQQVCQICDKSFYFSNSQNLYPQLSNFGIGNTILPYTTSNNLITVFLYVNSLRFSLAQFQLINVNIYLDIQYQGFISQYILQDIPQPNQLNITLSSYNNYQFSQNRAEVVINGDFIFQNFYQVSIINIQFIFSTLNNQCSLNLQNIQQLTLNNISIIGGVQEYSCYKINIYNSSATINNIFLNNFKSINNPYLIQAINSYNIEINNMQLINSEINNFQLLKQTQFTSLHLNNILIKDNYCNSNVYSIIQGISLFEIGQIQAKNVTILNNTFCNTNIFEIKYQKEYKNIVNKIEIISIYNNLIITMLQQFLLNAQFQELIQPDHQIDIKNIYISQNEVQNFIDPLQIKGAYIFNFQNIKFININQVIIQNSQSVGLGMFQNAIQLNINQTQFSSDQNYQMAKMYTDSQNYLKIIDVQNIMISQIDIRQKSVNNVDAISILVRSQEPKILIQDSIFENNFFVQSQIDQSSNMFYIFTSFNSTIILQNLTLLENYFLGRPDTMVVSASGFIIDNQFGIVLINNSSVNNQYTRSVYSPFYILASDLLIQQSEFQNILQISQLNDSQPNFFDLKIDGIFHGGIFNMFLQKNLQIESSIFQNSNSIVGGFFYIQGQYLQADINNSIFQNGMAQQGGSVFQLKISSYFNLTIQNSYFSNFVNYDDATSLFGINQDQDSLSQILISNVKFSQIYGVNTSNLINIKNCNITIQNVLIVEDLDALSNQYDQKFLNFIRSSQLSFSTVITSEQSYIYINEFSLKDISTISNSLLSHLLLQSSNSNIAIFNSYFQNCYFNEGGFGQVLNSNISLQNFHVENMTYVGSLKLNQQTNINAPNGFFLALIDSSLLLDKAFIFNIYCEEYCIGGFLQIQNFSYLLINNTTIKNVQAYQGGALCLYYQDNNTLIIKNSTFIKNQAYFEGGALFIMISLFQAQTKFEIDNIICNENISQNGEGGCLYAFNPNYYLLKEQPQFLIQNSNITQNQAQVGGGIVYYGTNLQYNSSLVYNNKAFLYCDNIFSQAKKIKYVNGSFSQDVEVVEIGNSLYLKNIQSGFVIHNLQFQLVNEFNQVVSIIEKYLTRQDYFQQHSMNFNYNNSNITYILTNSNKNNNTQPQYNPESKTFDLQNVKIQALPQQIINFNLTSTDISSRAYQDFNQGQNYSYAYQIYVSVVNCKMGYIPDTSTKIIPTCLPCYEGIFTFQYSVALPLLKLGQNLECVLKEIKTEPDILYQFFNLFSCTLIGNTYYLNADYSLECYNKEYFKHLIQRKILLLGVPQNDSKNHLYVYNQLFQLYTFAIRILHHSVFDDIYDPLLQKSTLYLN
ncbi:hypothetical protein ABPG74_016958 [Tetrahymena malaccensis]